MAQNKTTTLQPLVPLHEGYLEHPQNWLPARFPLRAVRRTIDAPHMGQAFDAGERAGPVADECVGVSGAGLRAG